MTSRSTSFYNCIAWAAGKTNNKWWPLIQKQRGYYWPPGISTDLTVAAFIQMFSSDEGGGYEGWADENPNLEDGWEKVAIYAKKDGEPTHAARQLSNGHWTSKIGDNRDIEHATLAVLEGDETKETIYGRSVKIMRRKRRPSPAPLA